MSEVTRILHRIVADAGSSQNIGTLAIASIFFLNFLNSLNDYFLLFLDYKSKAICNV